MSPNDKMEIAVDRAVTAYLKTLQVMLDETDKLQIPAEFENEIHAAWDEIKLKHDEFNSDPTVEKGKAVVNMIAVIRDKIGPKYVDFLDSKGADVSKLRKSPN